MPPVWQNFEKEQVFLWTRLSVIMPQLDGQLCISDWTNRYDRRRECFKEQATFLCTLIFNFSVLSLHLSVNCHQFWIRQYKRTRDVSRLCRMRISSAQVPYLADKVAKAVMAAYCWNSFALEYRMNSKTGVCLTESSKVTFKRKGT